ncbi:helicase HerA-like domain-containing protein [Terricaulis silvestris]|uniref:Ornithine/acetylornithine aminotransferase n=1 Tax=Terricaulis silvestris TaxID=2686094 RepID=A0A6I6MTP0_9CAUL|nr:helicase HerA-like domain-containing protein [Terricaulis silvestris]QGZ96738.1 Ornithine/acetylornithine aminotransferase [Terricaulis silvestris]
MASAIEFGASPEGVQSLALKRANRHGLIAGATGTGKTVTLQMLAEAFAREGVNVFAADIKGDLSGCAGTDPTPPGWATARAAEINLPLTPEAAPVVFWDVYGELGHPVRTTVTEMGPVLMGRVLEATDAQAGALTIAFRIADDWIKEGKNEGLLLDINDLRAMLTYLSENAEDIGKQYGLVTPQSIAALQRKLLQLEMDGAERFFGEPAFKLEELLKPRPDGKGTIHVLASERLVQSPRLYSAFLLWLMSELWEELPEVGDQDKPKLVFFFDEAHLLFRDAPKELINKVEQVVRLIRSKGVGIYFVTQSPTDIPEIVLSQLGNRFQHALRAYTPTDQKAVRAAAQSFRANENVDVAKEIQELGVGEALVSTLDEKGAPTPVARTKIRPPNGHVGPILLADRQALMRANTAGRVYEKAIDRESAHEILSERATQAAEAVAREEEREARDKEAARSSRTTGTRSSGRTSAPRRTGGSRTTAVERQTGRVASGVFNTIVRELMRGILGTPRRRR